jgi:hypothetical protein
MQAAETKAWNTLLHLPILSFSIDFEVYSSVHRFGQP